MIDSVKKPIFNMNMYTMFIGHHKVNRCKIPYHNSRITWTWDGFETKNDKVKGKLDKKQLKKQIYILY
jgi:hypothetical protein